MKRILLALFLLVSAVFVSSGAQKDTLRILAIGNSFSEDAVEDHLYPIASEKGVTLIIGNMYIGGCSLQRHADNIRNNKADYSYRKISADGNKTVTNGDTLADVINDEDWDIVTLQESSPISGIKDNYFPYIVEIMDFVKSECPDAEIVFHMTWAYDPDTYHKGFANYDNDQITMYNAIMNTVGEVVREVGIKRVIPCATAMQNARTTSLDDKVNRPDGFHLSLPHGRYIAACVWVEKLLGKNVKGVMYCPDGMTQEECRLAQNAAHAAVRKPNRITVIK